MVLRGGRLLWLIAVDRSGKTTACLNHLIRDSLRISNSKYAYIAPTYKQSKNVAWDILKEYTSKIDGVKFNESELRCDFKNGSRITLYGSDNPDSLRGIGLWGVIYDEYSQQPSNIHSEIIRPALADHNGYAIWIGTPKGKNDFYRLFQQAKEKNNWLAILLTVGTSKLISEAELKDARAVMTPDEFNQEFHCSFDASIKGAYYAEEIALARKEKRITKVDYDNSIPVYTVWDLGISDAMAIGFYQKVNQELRMIEYVEETGKGLDYFAKLLQDKPYTYAKHIAPFDIKQRELSTGKSRLEIARDLGIEFEVLPRVSVADGIHAGRMLFSRLWVDEKRCQVWLDYIAQYHREWDDDKGMFKDNPLHDFTSHSADMYRYTALAENRMKELSGDILVDTPIDTDWEYGIVVKGGEVTGEQMLYEKETKDWRYN